MNLRPISVIEHEDFVANFLWELTDDGEAVYELHDLTPELPSRGKFVLVNGEYVPLETYVPLPENVAKFEHWLHSAQLLEEDPR